MRFATVAKAALPLGALALLLAGCSSNDTSGGGASSTDSATTTASGDATSASDGAASGTDVALVTPGKLTVCTNPPFAPFEYTEGDSIVGFDMDLAGEVAKDLGVQLSPLAAPFESIESGVALDSGTCDIIASGVTITDLRKDKIDFSKPYFDDDLGVLVLKTSPITGGGEQLKGKTVSVQQATTGAKYCQEQGGQCQEFKDVGLQVQAVATGGADAAVNNLSVMADAVTKNQDLKVVEKIPSGEQYGIGVKKGNTALLNAVDATLDRIKSDGTYDTLYAKYFSAVN